MAIVPSARLVVALLALVALLASAAPTRAQDQVLDANGTDYIEVFDPGWDSNVLTVSLKAGKSVEQVYRDAVVDAIDAWNAAQGYVEFVYVTEKVAASQADINIILTSGNTGGVVFGGRALCSAPGCHQVLTSTVLNLYTYELVYGTMLHELGHTIGLGHAQPIETSRDIMGYGWILDYTGVIPAISACDVDALAVIWAWVGAGTGPQPPAADTVDC